MRTWFRSRGLFCASVIALFMAAAAPISAEDGPISKEHVRHIDQPFTKLELVEKSTRVLELKGRISTVDVGDPEVLTATKVENPFNPRQLRLTAEAPGITDIMIVDEFGQSHKLEVLVIGDVRHLQTLLQMTFPNSALQVTKVQNTAVLNGWVDEPSQIRPIIQLTEQFFPEPINNIQVGGVQQVLLKVKVMEVQRGKIRNLGFNFIDIGNDFYLTSNPGNLIPINEMSAGIGAATSFGFDPSNPTAMFGVIGESNIFQGFIEALKQESLLKILAEPNLTVKSGQKANLLQGGEFPILVPQSLGTLSIEFKSFGVKLEALPIVLGNGRLSLQVIPEVSERDLSSAVEINGTIVPGLTTRRVQTAVEMEFGQTFAIAGLIFDRQTASTFKVPLLGELPVLGALFRRVQYNQTETELLVMVTPELADPLQPEQVPCYGPGQNTTAPNDRELYFDGALEVPNYGGPNGMCPDDCLEGGACMPGGAPMPGPVYYNNGAQPAPAVVPPMPPAAGEPTPAPPAPGPEANRQGAAGPKLGQSAAQPGLITPRFTAAAANSATKTAAVPNGATPYRAPTTRSVPQPGRYGSNPALQTASTAPRARTVSQTRANSVPQPTQVTQQQQTKWQSSTTMVRRASSSQQEPTNPALAFPDANRRALMNELNPRTEASAPAAGLIPLPESK